MSSGIYVITNQINTKFYVGSSNNVPHRIVQHRSKLRRNLHDNIHLQRSWNKYGESVFQFELIYPCSEQELLIKEQVLIDELEPQYNINKNAFKPPSFIGKTLSQTSRDKIRAKLLGVKHSAERVEKSRLGRIGIVQDQAWVQKRVVKMYRPIMEYDESGNPVKLWQSLKELSKHACNKSNAGLRAALKRGSKFKGTLYKYNDKRT